MIFISLGSQKFQFDRLLQAADALDLDEEIFAQIGYSNYRPVNYKYTEFLDRDEYSRIINKADIVITHGGSGVIIEAVKRHKKVIAVPRLAKYGEHVDDHQLQLVKEFSTLGLICACEDMDLARALDEAKSSSYKEYVSNTQAIIDSLEAFIEQ